MNKKFNYAFLFQTILFLAVIAIIVFSSGKIISIFEGEKTDIAVIGKHSFTHVGKNDFKEIASSKADKEVSKHTKVILVSTEEKIPYETLQKWIENRSVILYYGPDVKKEIINNTFKLNYDLEKVFVTPSFEVKQNIIGYGYSKDQQKEIVFYNQYNGEYSSNSVMKFAKEIVDNNK